MLCYRTFLAFGIGRDLDAGCIFSWFCASSQTIPICVRAVCLRTAGSDRPWRPHLCCVGPFEHLLLYRSPLGRFSRLLTSIASCPRGQDSMVVLVCQYDAQPVSFFENINGKIWEEQFRREVGRLKEQDGMIQFSGSNKEQHRWDHVVNREPRDTWSSRWCTWKAADDGSKAVGHATPRWETGMEFLAPGFSLPQLW